MSSSRRHVVRFCSGVAIAALPAAAATVLIRLILGAVDLQASLLLWVCAAFVLAVSHYGSPYRIAYARYVLPWPGIVTLVCGVLAAVHYALSGATVSAWIAMLVGWIALSFLANLLRSPHHWLQSGIVWLLTSGVGGAMPVLLTQLQSQFAEEEFFVALQVVVLTTFSIGIWIGDRILQRYSHRTRSRGIAFPQQPALVIGSLGVFLVGCLAIRGYRHSFYAEAAPSYPGIGTTEPFICNEVVADTGDYDGEDVFWRLLARVEANPNKGTPEYGMLALATADQRWAELFRASILEEASLGRFTEPANSVKYGQYSAATRAYYYPRVREAYPSLFSDQDVARLNGWFSDINVRTMTSEWVDVLYGLAFSMWPEGPYENQENGAGLLALLETHRLAAPHLSEANRTYLAQNERGWNQRFRNTDDALVYQLEWINNAYFQSLYRPAYSEMYREQAFEWLLLQSLPDGGRIGYNHIGQPTLAGVAYLGAILLEDPRYVWLAGRSLDVLEARGEYLAAQPGVEAPVTFTGRSPTSGSCLLYGGSGLPNQLGPLAPDKIVLRDGWSPDATYVLLNLRFTGWHRYKATNTLSLLYQGTPLIREVSTGESFDWLPEGRSLFRDKRIPRENLNGLLIPRTGLSAVLRTLTGVGSRWAQDPPRYVTVKAFRTNGEATYAHTRLEDWHGWQHDRSIYFSSGEDPIVVLDQAEGPDGQTSHVSWHLVDAEAVEANRVLLRGLGVPVEVVWVPWGTQVDLLLQEYSDGSINVQCVGYPGELAWVTIVLQGDWVGADVALDAEAEILSIGTMELPLDPQRFVPDPS